jgi:tetratricopeptide (TPR) repeat protein
MADVPAYFSAIVLYSNICIKLSTRLAEAERFLKNALILAAKVHREQMIPSIVYMLLDIYKRENDLEGKKAILEYIRQKHSTMLERLSEQPRYSFETHDRFSNINAIVSMGRLLIKGKCFAEAERCFNVATDLISGLNYDNGCIPSIEGIAEFYLKLGDRSKAGAFLEQHLENAIKHRELLPLYQELLDEIPYMREGLEIEGFKLELFSTLERDGICEAEDLLFSWLDTYPYVDFRELAKEFYELLSAKSDSELLQNDFSREEITDGYNDVIERYEL